LLLCISKTERFYNPLIFSITGSQKKNKSSLYSLNTFRVTRVSGAHLRGFAPRPTQSRLQQWQVIGNV